MSSTESEVATQRADDGLSEKDKSVGDLKSDSSPLKRGASEIAEDGDVKQKVLKTDHKDKENGEEKYDDGDAEDGDEEDEAVPEGEDYDEDGEGEEDGAEEDDEEDGEDEA